jgi:hypothetical protein
MCKEMPVIWVNRVVDKKRIIRKNGGPRRRRGTRRRLPPQKGFARCLLTGGQCYDPQFSAVFSNFTTFLKPNVMYDQSFASTNSTYFELQTPFFIAKFFGDNTLENIACVFN